MKLGAFFVEILPLLAFFVGYQYFGLIAAAALSVAIGAAVMGLAWLRERRLAAFPLFSLPCRLPSRWRTGLGEAFHRDPADLPRLFSLVLLGGLMTGRAMMQLFFEGQFSLTADTWRRLFRWGCSSCCWRWRMKSSARFQRGLRSFTRHSSPRGLAFMLAQLPLTLAGVSPPIPASIGDDAAVIGKQLAAVAGPSPSNTRHRRSAESVAVNSLPAGTLPWNGSKTVSTVPG